MAGYVRYLVRVQCQPSPEGCEEQIFRALSDSFGITRCYSTSAGLAFELQASHPLAYGVFKDLADLVKETLTELDLRLLSGSIHRVERHSWSAVVDAFNLGTGDSTFKDTGKGVLSFLSGSPLGRLVDGFSGGTRLVPVMYFYEGVFIDLVLSARARRLAMQAAPGAN